MNAPLVIVLLLGFVYSPMASAQEATVQSVIQSSWFYGLDIIGTIAFGIAGFIRAAEEDYDIGGMCLLTALPAVGGGTLRDLMVGGERLPPFIFNDPTYLYIVFFIVLIGAPLDKHWPQIGKGNSFFSDLMFVSDTIGLSAFSVIGASVAISAELHWFWAPICAALTCAGGGILLDICTGRPPRVLREDHYEELAAVGGFMLYALLGFSAWLSATSDSWSLEELMFLSVLLTLAFVFTARFGIVRLGWGVPFQSQAEEQP